MWGWWRLQTLIFLVLLTPVVSEGQVTNLAFSQNARTFETQEQSLTGKGMAFACLALVRLPDGLPCNPASTPKQKAPSLGIEGLISNGYSTLSTMQKLLSGSVDQSLVDALFGSQRVLQIEGNSEIHFISKYLSVRYTPVSLKYFSVVRNEADPDVDLYAVQEDNLTIQTGSEIFKKFYLGLQIRRVDRKYIHQQFPLLELTTDQGKGLLTPQSEQATYFEPGVEYTLPGSWRPTISTMLVNFGLTAGNFSGLPEPTEVQVALGISPPVEWGDLHTEIDYRSLSYQEASALNKLHLGAIYSFGAMSLSGGVDYNGISGGIFYGVQQVNAGIMYSTNQVFWRNEDYYAQTVYIQAGWQI